MRMLSGFSPEASERMVGTIEEAQELPPGNSRLRTLFTNGESLAVAGLLLGDSWRIVAESSKYEPMGSALSDVCQTAPFMTTGLSWLLNPYNGSIHERIIKYEEGEVQGLLYALDAISHGGKLEPAGYIDWLIDDCRKFEAEASHNDQDDGGCLPLSSELLGLLEQAGIVTVERRLIKVSYQPA